MPKEKGALSKISDDVRLAILQITLEHPEKKRDSLAQEIAEFLQSKDIIPPTYGTLLRMISRIRNRESDPKDNPFNLGAIVKHRIPIEMTKNLLELQAWGGRQYTLASLLKEKYPPLTIRESIWATVVFKALGPTPKREKEKEQRLRFVWDWARVYGINEIVGEIYYPKNLIDTSALDAAMLRGAKPLIFGRDGYLVAPTEDPKTWVCNTLDPEDRKEILEQMDKEESDERTNLQTKEW